MTISNRFYESKWASVALVISILLNVYLAYRNVNRYLFSTPLEYHAIDTQNNQSLLAKGETINDPRKTRPSLQPPPDQSHTLSKNPNTYVVPLNIAIEIGTPAPFISTQNGASIKISSEFASMFALSKQEVVQIDQTANDYLTRRMILETSLVETLSEDENHRRLLIPATQASEDLTKDFQSDIKLLPSTDYLLDSAVEFMLKDPLFLGASEQDVELLVESTPEGERVSVIVGGRSLRTAYISSVDDPLVRRLAHLLF